ncbi:Hypothetical predicted protein [Octopus vulgaris]|uniref:PiggyBac transposable element-derived protein domain-containing protein n=1 Tax=Octopus vulgaris TaxID=6645 RepID=A0AA36FBG1_OCTVU|nr:Hypothetical predicted protein [Octopus vulgaris]
MDEDLDTFSNHEIDVSFHNLESSGDKLDTCSSDSDNFSEDDKEDNQIDARAWHEINCLSDSPLPPPSPLFPFTDKPGINLEQDPSSMTPLDCFQLYFDESLLDLIGKETNRMAESKASNWEPVTPPEMMFLGVKMLMGIVKKPEEEMIHTDHIDGYAHIHYKTPEKKTKLHHNKLNTEYEL